MAFSSDGRVLAIGYVSDNDGPSFIGRYGVLLYDAVKLTPLQKEPIILGYPKITDMAFKPDEQTLAVCFSSGFSLLDVNPSSWRHQVENIVNRNFSKKEWAGYFPDEPYRAIFPDLPIPRE
jgi:hypothetical protein